MTEEQKPDAKPDAKPDTRLHAMPGVTPDDGPLMRAYKTALPGYWGIFYAALQTFAAMTVFQRSLTHEGSHPLRVLITFMIVTLLGAMILQAAEGGFYKTILWLVYLAMPAYLFYQAGINKLLINDGIVILGGAMMLVIFGYLLLVYPRDEDGNVRLSGRGYIGYRETHGGGE
jgi:hypothetical protein